MAAENLIKADDLQEDIRLIDFVNRFGQSIKDLMSLLGITMIQKLDREAIIRLYKWAITDPTKGANTAEGETIPLTHITRKEDKLITLELAKYRTEITYEAIYRAGREISVNQKDRQLLRHIQGKIRDRFFAFLDLAPTTQTTTTGGGLQEAIAIGWGKSQSYFEDANGFITLVNPMDVAKFIGQGNLQSGASTAYGLTLLEGFVGQKVMSFNHVPQGTIYTTASENLNLAAADVRGAAGSEFGMVSDETGLIGVFYGQPDGSNLTKGLTAIEQMAIFAEVPEGVVKTTIA